MENTPMEPKKKHNIFMYVSIVLFIVCIVLTWQVVSLKSQKGVLITEKDSLSAEKQELIGKLENLKKQYDQLSTDNKQLTDMFNAEKEHVEKLLAKIKNSQGSIAKYKKQLSLMEGRLKEYEQQIEELKNQNKALTAENFHIKTVLDSTTTENKELNTKNTELTETVSKGSALHTYDINSDGIIVKAKGKEVPTKKVKRVEKIRVCFTIGENSIATAGAKDIYLRIADPNGTILSQGEGDEYSFTFEGKKLQYSSKDQITYNNKAADLCLYWTKMKDFVPGTYTVDIFAEGKTIGTSTFTLEK
jgi:predicted nuclease with TOPRIM domain